MTFDRRSLLTAGLGAGASLAAATAAMAGARTGETKHQILVIAEASLEPDTARDQTAQVQAAIDEAANRGVPLQLPAGRLRVGQLTLRAGSRIIGASQRTIFEFAGGSAFITAEDVGDVALEDLVIDGAERAFEGMQSSALVHFKGCEQVLLRQVVISRSAASGVMLERCSGRVSDCTIFQAAKSGLHILDATGIELLHNTIRDCANNGIQVWRSAPGTDGTLISGNRIERIAAKAGGSGENGNGINVFRAGDVLVTGNRIAECAYSAIRGNAASNIQMVANSCAKIGEVALYAEFGFEGAMIASNVINGAASGIAVTNFNEGGRLAVVQGNLIRNLVRREQEPVDKRGIGISVEADSLVTGNTIENAQTAGIAVGWGKYMRDCVVTQNLVRNATVGILVSNDGSAGNAFIAGNLISGTTEGAIRAMDLGEATGPDLALEPDSKGRITISGNVATGSDASSTGWRGWFSPG